MTDCGESAAASKLSQSAPLAQAAPPAAALLGSSSSSSNVALAGGAVCAGVVMFLVTRLLSGGPSLAALEQQSVPLGTALSNGKPTVVEFYANWWVLGSCYLLRALGLLYATWTGDAACHTVATCTTCYVHLYCCSAVAELDAACHLPFDVSQSL